MRVAVVGATGNTGTAVLRALADAPEVTSVLGIARRMPDTDVDPYSGCEWASIDIAAASSPDEAGRALEAAFAGADAVIHLAWLIQPNSRRNLLRRVNVDGTERVARAAAAAGVRQLVVASSVGAYSPDDGAAAGAGADRGGDREAGADQGRGAGPDHRGETDEPSGPDLHHGLVRRDESWPVRGVRTSHYSVDKAAQERVLDEFSAAHPEVTVTRLRPALVFQEDAASEIQRYFLGDWLPVQLLDSAQPPALPLPRGLRGVQAVHADDLARAYVAAVVRGVGGAFNICADDVLRPQDLADIIDHGRYVELPPRLVRAFLFGGHKAGLIAADEGWIDMAMAVPVMDSTRARTELDWRPRHTAADALRSLLRGMVEGRGAGSIPLRPRDPEDTRLPASGETVGRGADDDAGVKNGPRIPDRVSRELLGLYLSDHLTGATAGADRAERMAASAIDTPVYARLSETAEEIRLERTFLQQLIDDLGLRQRGYRQAVAWAGEHLGRLKGNGRTFSRSPLTLVLEAELMRSAVVGKLGVWQTLGELAAELGLDPDTFADLAEQARQQAAVFDEVHEYAREHAFQEDRETFGPQHTRAGAPMHAQSADPEHPGADAEPSSTDPSPSDPDPSPTDPDTSPTDPDASPSGSGSRPGPDSAQPEEAERAAPADIAEKPGTSRVSHEHEDELVDEWGRESFPGSDPPAHY